MNFRQIEAFRTVMTSGSVTGAAAVLSVSQPAVSRLLGDLERSVGFPLFRRRGRNLVFTQEGQAFYAEVNRAFVGLEDIKTAADAIKSYQAGTLNLVTMPSLASSLLPALLAPFSRRYPDIGIWVEVLTRSEVLKAMLSGQYDLGVVSGPVNQDDLSVEPLCQLQAYCVLPVGHRLENRDHIHPTDLASERVITLARDSLFRYHVITLLKTHDVSCRTDIQARTADAIYGLIAAGLGISVVGPELPRQFDKQRIVFKPLSPPLAVDIELVSGKNSTLSRLGTLFSQMALSNVQAVVNG